VLLSDHHVCNHEHTAMQCTTVMIIIIAGTSVRVTPAGVVKVPGIFISRLVPGGLAESTGLLAVNDEVLEVNAIDVRLLACVPSLS